MPCTAYTGQRERKPQSVVCCVVLKWKAAHHGRANQLLLFKAVVRPTINMF